MKSAAFQKVKQELVWINLFNTAHGTEEQTEYTACIKPKQTNIFPSFLSTY
jgi:hypothetical protein